MFLFDRHRPIARFALQCLASREQVDLTPDDLKTVRRIALRTLFQSLHRCIDPAGAMRHAGSCESHLYARQGAKQCEFVAFAEVTDAEHLSGKLGESGTE